jgi:hypothetical protein
LTASVSRRQLLGSGLAAAGTAVLVAAPWGQAASTATVWGLDPHSGHEGCGGCAACAACLAHAANKIFASAADADSGRAHPHCKCAVTQLSSVEPYVYNALFVSGGRRSSVDRRWQWVQAALTSAAPILPAQPPAVATPGAGGTNPPPNPSSPSRAAASGNAAGRARLRAAWMRRLAPHRRVLFLQLDTPLPVAATVNLSRNGRRLMHRQPPVSGGRHTLRIALPARLTHGPAKLRLTFRDDNGGTHTATRNLSIPAKQLRQRMK